MKLYNAMMRAANHIESMPKDFDFFSIEIPKNRGCGTPGCAIGWIAYFHEENSFKPEPLTFKETPGGCFLEHGGREDGINEPLVIGYFPKRVLGVSSNVFYSRMSALQGEEDRWQFDAKTCAITLRAYAAKYHAPELPNEVKEIFDATENRENRRVCVSG